MGCVLVEKLFRRVDAPDFNAYILPTVSPNPAIPSAIASVRSIAIGLCCCVNNCLIFVFVEVVDSVPLDTCGLWQHVLILIFVLSSFTPYIRFTGSSFKQQEQLKLDEVVSLFPYFLYA